MEELFFKGNQLKVDPLNGAAITHWSCLKKNQVIALIDNKAFNSFESSLLFPFPNRLAEGKYSFENTSYQFPLNDFGRPNALHGLIHNKEFRLVDKQEDLLQFAYEYAGNAPYYPFPFRLEITYLIKENELELNITIKNLGFGKMPCGFGWHPYFDISISERPCWLKLPSVNKIEVDQNLIPIGKEEEDLEFKNFQSVEEKKLDNCYRLERIAERSSVFLKYPELGTIEVWQDGNCPFIQVFKPDERTMAIEPMTCGIDAFNTKEGLKVLRSREEWVIKIGLRFY